MIHMRLFRIYLLSALLHLKEHLIYRASVLIWLFSMVLEPVVFMMVWRAVALAEGGSAGGHTQGTLTAYYLTMMVVNHLTFTWIMHEYAYRIREGVLAGQLLYPLHPIHRDITMNATYKLLGLALFLPALLLLGFFLHPEFHIEPWQALTFLPALALAAATRFLMEWALAQSAFWFIENSSINQAYYVTTMFFSGRVAPISMFPDWLSTVARYLPFWLSVAFPVETLLGSLTPDEVVSGMVVQTAWLAFFAGFVAWVWSRAVRRFGAVGG